MPRIPRRARALALFAGFLLLADAGVAMVAQPLAVVLLGLGGAAVVATRMDIDEPKPARPAPQEDEE